MESSFEELIKEYEEAQKQIFGKICKEIQEYVGHNITCEKAVYIWNVAYEKGHICGTDEIMACLYEVMDFACAILS